MTINIIYLITNKLTFLLSLMKTNKDFQTKGNASGAEDLLRKAAKLDPIKKSGKDRHRVFASSEEDEDIIIPRHKESVLDYFDDVPEDEIAPDSDFDEELEEDDFDDEDSDEYDEDEDFDDDEDNEDNEDEK